MDNVAFEAEVKSRWGSTAEYAECEAKRKNRTKAENDAVNEGLFDMFAPFASLRSGSPSSDEAKKAARALQAYITKHYYTCTDEIFASLGQMYATDGRFRDNIDSRHGEGTAELASRAIAELMK